MKKIIKLSKLIFIFFLIPLVNNCASIVQGSDQVITIETPNCPGATCRLTNNDGTYYINKTPGTITINKSRSELMVSCYIDSPSNAKLTSSSSKVENMTFGNILIGGIIGGGVDMATGAAYKYPSYISHPLACSDEVEGEKENREKKIKELERAIEKLKNT